MSLWSYRSAARRQANSILSWKDRMSGLVAFSARLRHSSAQARHLLISGRKCRSMRAPTRKQRASVKEQRSPTHRGAGRELRSRGCQKSTLHGFRMFSIATRVELNRSREVGWARICIGVGIERTGGRAMLFPTQGLRRRSPRTIGRGTRGACANGIRVAAYRRAG